MMNQTWRKHFAIGTLLAFTIPDSSFSISL
jgi:hypothetical protein